MTEFTKLFNQDSVKRRIVSEPACVEEEAPKPKPKPKSKEGPTCPPPGCKFVTNVTIACKEEGEKPYLVQECFVWDEECGAWVYACEEIGAWPVVYKAGAALPSFNGTIDALTAEGKVLELEGKQEVPANMSGSIFCINERMCYIPGDITIPAEIQCGGDAPDPESGIKLWIDEGIHKSYNQSIGKWVQGAPHGGNNNG